MGIMVIVQCESDLLQLIAALRPASSFPSRLNSRQQQRHKQSNNAEDDKQFDKRKRATVRIRRRCFSRDDDLAVVSRPSAIYGVNLEEDTFFFFLKLRLLDRAAFERERCSV